MPLMVEFSPQGSWIAGPVFYQETVAQTLRTGVVIHPDKTSHGSSTLHHSGGECLAYMRDSSMRASHHVAWRPRCRGEPVFRQR